jgi:uncharacterized protein YidB (DUF937 family)
MLENLMKTLSEKTPEIKKTIQATLDQYGGVSGLIQALRAPENREKLKVWVSDGKDFILSHEQVQKLLGHERIQKIAEKAALAPEKVVQVLAEILPPLVQKLEALGNQIPENSVVGKVLDKVKGLLNKSAP